MVKGGGRGEEREYGFKVMDSQTTDIHLIEGFVLNKGVLEVWSWWWWWWEK